MTRARAIRLASCTAAILACALTARAQDGKDIPRAVAFDEAVSKLDATSNAGRDDYGQILGLLLDGIQQLENEGGIRFEIAPSKRWKIGFSLRQPVLSDEARNLLDNDQEQEALRGLAPSDDLTIDVKLGLGVPDPPRMRRLILSTFRPRIDEFLADRASELAAARFGAQADDLDAWARLNRPQPPEWRETKLEYWGLHVALRALEQRRASPDPPRSAVSDLEPPGCGSLSALFEHADPKPPFLVMSLGQAPHGLDCDAVRKRAIDLLGQSGQDLEQVLLARLDEVQDEHATVLEREWAEASARNEAMGADPSEFAGATEIDQLFNELMTSVYIAERNRFQGAVSIVRRQRDDLLGADVTSVAGNFTFGLPRLPRDEKAARTVVEAWLERKLHPSDSAADVAALRKLSGHPHSFALQLAWSDTRSVHVSTLPALDRDGFTEAAFSFNWSTKIARDALQVAGFPAGIDSALTLDFKKPAEKAAHDRFIATWTLTFHLRKDVQLPLTLTYANREEFIDEDDVRGHFGISYTFPARDRTMKGAS